MAAEPGLVSPPPRYSTVAWGALVGVVFGGLCLWLLGLLATVAGLVGNEWTTHEPRGPLETPYPNGGAWSTLANLAIGVAAALILGRCIWDRVERATKREASFRRIALIVLVAGYAPYVVGVRRGGLVLCFLLVAYLIRRFAIGAPTVAWPRRVRLAVLGVVAAALLVPASYGATHPLWYGTHVFASGSVAPADWRAHRITFRPIHDTVVRVGITIENHGRASVTVLGVTGGTESIRLVRALGGSLPPEAGTRPLRGAVVHPGSEQPVTLVLRLRACGSTPRLDTLDRVTARYRLGGGAFSQPILLAIRPTVVC